MRSALVLSLAAAACGTSSIDSALNGQGTPENPAAATDGPYTVTNTVDLTVEAVLPAPAEMVVATLRTFSTNPARALITLAGAAGVPEVNQLYALMPQPIKDQLEGWINAQINMVQINGMPITAYAGKIAALADTELSSFNLDSELMINGTTSVHKLTALDLSPTGYNLKVPITGLAQDILTQTPTITVGDGGALTIGEQRFGLNYGEYAWQGLEAISKLVFGDGIRETLGKAINCPHVAEQVSMQCALPGVCVGHQAELQAICEGGLDQVVNQVHNRLAMNRINALHLTSGTATLVDDTGDGVADRITKGVWAAELNLGMGLRHTPSTFTGSR